MKKAILFMALVVCSFYVFAQNDDDDKTFKFGLGGAIAIPLSDLKASTTYGIGFEAIGVYNLSESIAAFAEAGIHVFKGKAVYGGDAGSVLHIPVIAGARFKINGFFVGAGAGFGSWSSSGTSLSGFLYSPQIGYDLGKMQLLLHYTSGSVTGGTFSYAGLKFFRTF